MPKKIDKDALEKMILVYVQQGCNTISELARRFKVSKNVIDYSISHLVHKRLLHGKKINNITYYSTFMPEASPAHDPFGLCHGQTQTRDHGSQQVH